MILLRHIIAGTRRRRSDLFDHCCAKYTRENSGGDTTLDHTRKELRRVNIGRNAKILVGRNRAERRSNDRTRQQ